MLSMLYYIFFVILLHPHRGAGAPMYKCDFEDCTMCEMNNQQNVSVNFTITTSDQTMSVDKKLGPSMDYTLQKPSGHFLSWYSPSKETHVANDGLIMTPSINIMPNSCLRFAYFINSSKTLDTLTTLVVGVFYCGQTSNLWEIETGNTLGWQMVEQQLTTKQQCSSTTQFFIFVSSNTTQGVSVAFDNIVVDICQTIPNPITPLIAVTRPSAPTPVTPSRAPKPPTPITPSRASTPPKPPTPPVTRATTQSSGQHREPHKLFSLFSILLYVFVILRKSE